ncbi:MAG TPA: restriction endonuclease [Salinivirgaceae bacterium]|nr:restriction endonuclease [Salinivirgaceae bacterium]
MIPSYEEIMLPLLKMLSDGKEYSLQEADDFLSGQFNLTEEERRELLPSGQQPVFRNRLGWARTYMKKAGLLTIPKRAHFKITERGIELLKEKPTKITSKLLMRYQEFVDFKSIKMTKDNGEEYVENNHDVNTDKTPEESLEYAYQKLRSELAKEVLDVVKSCSPAFFEKLVIDLLIRMGYGGSRKDAGQAMGKSGDGGIDGIVKEDKLGLDTIYLQAKRWEKPVPVKGIRDFTGALASKKARKGIFITTSTFPKSVYEFVTQVEYKIVLIDGEQLAYLMIENNVGLSTVNEYQVKRIDTDYFEEN